MEKLKPFTYKNLNAKKILNFFTNEELMKKLDEKVWVKHGLSPNFFVDRLLFIVMWMSDWAERVDVAGVRNFLEKETDEAQKIADTFRTLMELTKEKKPVNEIIAAVRNHFQSLLKLFLIYNGLVMYPARKITEDGEKVYEEFRDDVLVPLWEQLVIVDRLYNPETSEEMIKNIDPSTTTFYNEYAEKIFKREKRPEIDVTVYTKEIKTFFENKILVEALWEKSEKDLNFYSNRIKTIVSGIGELFGVKNKQVDEELKKNQLEAVEYMSTLLSLFEYARSVEENKDYTEKVDDYYEKVCSMINFYNNIRSYSPEEVQYNGWRGYYDFKRLILKPLRELLIITETLFDSKRSETFIENIDSTTGDLVETYSREIFNYK